VDEVEEEEEELNLFGQRVAENTRGGVLVHDGLSTDKRS